MDLRQEYYKSDVAFFKALITEHRLSTSSVTL
jgi:hypothetical protein